MHQDRGECVHRGSWIMTFTQIGGEYLSQKDLKMRADATTFWFLNEAERWDDMDKRKKIKFPRAARILLWEIINKLLQNTSSFWLVCRSGHRYWTGVPAGRERSG